MKKRSLAGNVGIGIFLVGLICVFVAFGTSAWLVSDYRINNAKLDTIGLWRQCFKSLPNPADGDAPRRFFVGCRWIYNPFVTGYSEIRGFTLPTFMVATQFFFTICFLAFLAVLVLTMIYVTCRDPEKKNYAQLIASIGGLLILGSVCGCVAVIVFACFGSGDEWIPGRTTNYLGWSFALAVIGSVLGLVAALLFFVEASVQNKKRRHVQEAKAKFRDPYESRT